MTANEWWNARPAPRRPNRVGGRTLGGIVGGFITVIVMASIAAWWNSHSNGGLIHALGGVTSVELAEVAKHPGPPGPPGAASAPAPMPILSVTVQRAVDLDKSGPVPDSEGAAFCTLSKIALRRYVPHPDRSYELSPGAQHNDPWQVVVDGAVCGISCVTLEQKQ
jgi:hypothetical protein